MMRNEHQGHSSVEREPIAPLAIIGFAFKFPGDTDTTDSLWRVLQEKKCLMTEWPRDRFRMDAFFQKPSDGHVQKGAVLGGNFLKSDPGLFDASFFGISATEAMTMDPQSRILLEVTYHALENAGIRMEDVAGSKTGVYSGAMSNDYAFIAERDVDNLPKYSASGNSQSMIANRISWFYDLRGPSIHMDSACSSSLMAFDIACESLRSHSTDMVVVAGASMCTAMEGILSLTDMGFLSPEGKCFSFDHRANGYSRGEGFSVVLVKRLDDAISEGNTIRAVVRSTGANQDGHTPGITQPSIQSQAELIRSTYNRANLSLKLTRFFEAHGTGTAIGDPIEAEAIGRTFRKSRSPREPLYIGALKSNVGHLEGGSGLAALIKTVMVLERAVIPPNANFERLNPGIDADFLNIKFPTECVPWPSNGIRRASVASFGFGGANAHVVLDDAYHFLKARGLTALHRTTESPPVLGAGASPTSISNATEHNMSSTSRFNGSIGRDQFVSVNGADDTDKSSAKHHYQCLESGCRIVESALDVGPVVNGEASASTYSSSILTPASRATKEARQGDTQLLIFSAADAAGVRRLTDAHQTHFRNMPRDDLAASGFIDQLAYTLANRRSMMAWRSFALVDEPKQLLNISGMISEPQSVEVPAGIAFVFTGQGAQYPGMGVALLKHPTFRSVIMDYDAAIAKLGSPFSILGLLEGRTSREDIHDPACSQTAMTALQMALIALLQDINILPKVVVGHSSGEIAAAYAAGALDFASACKVSYFRGMAASMLAHGGSHPGAMLAVNQTRNSVQDRINRNARYTGKLHVACINSPRNVTVSGDEPEVDMLQSEFASEGIFARKLNTRVAYHSPQMQSIASYYAKSIEGIRRAKSCKDRPVLVSTVTGEVVRDLHVICLPQYWVRNMVSAVEFTAAMDASLAMTVSNQTWKLGDVRGEVIQDIVEIGPHCTLRRPVLDILDHNKLEARVTYHHVQDRGRPAVESMQRVIGQLFARGFAVNVGALASSDCSSPAAMAWPRPDLPSYPFDHSKSYWYETAASRHARLRTGPKLELLGTPVSDWNRLEARWRKSFDVTATPWIGEHQVNGRIIYPATGMLTMALEAAAQLADSNRQIKALEIYDAIFSNPISINELERTEVELCLRFDLERSDKKADCYDFRIYTRGNDGSLVNCRGSCYVHYESNVEGFLTADSESQDRHYQDRFAGMRHACGIEVSSMELYTLLRKNGLLYGDSFQCLDQIASDQAGSAIARLSSFRWTAGQSCNARQAHIVHPTTLDGAAQLACAALITGSRQTVFKGFAVTRIEKLWVTGAGVSFPNTPVLQACCNASFKGHRSATADIVATDVTGAPKLMLSGMECTAVDGMTESLTLVAPRHIAFDIHWKADPDFLDAANLISLAQETAVPSTSGEFHKDLERVQRYYTVRVLKEKPNHVDIATHLQRYLSWLEEQVSPGESSPSCTVSMDRMDETNMENVIHRVENASAKGNLVVQIGRNLPEIICGQTDPLGIVFKSGLAVKIYNESFDNMTYRLQLREYLDCLRHKQPGLKVVEVGAGTGAVTGLVLDVLSSNEHLSEYTYTDISSVFFDDASARFSAFKTRMSFRALNIESDPVDQGFEACSYDIVIASQVLHATSSLRNSLGNVRRLLRPGGKLVLLETVDPTVLSSAFVFGTLESWWSSVDEDRQSSPCLSEKQWNALLERNGFSGIDIFLPDDQNGFRSEMSLMLSTAMSMDDPDHAPATLNQQLVLIYDPDSKAQVAVKTELEASVAAKSHISCSAISAAEISQLSVIPETVLVSLVELDNPYLAEVDEGRFRALKDMLVTSPAIIWVAGVSQPESPHYPGAHMVAGLARTLTVERTSLTFVILTIEGTLRDFQRPAQRILQVLKSLEDRQAGCFEYREQDGVLLIPRVLPSYSMDNEIHRRIHVTASREKWADAAPLTLSIGNPGLLDTLRFIEAPSRSAEALQADEIEIEVRAIGVNFRDLFVALGKLPITAFGCEIAGIVTRVGQDSASSFQPGQRVMVLELKGCVTTFVRSKALAAKHIPENLSFAQAASIPVTALTAYWGLIRLANLRRDESVLIHSAAGGTGQMAVQVALSVGAEIFITVGTEEKKRLMHDMYGIPEDHIFGSRDTSFAQGISRATNGKGVNVVFNSLTGHALTASWEIIAKHGRFIEIGKADIYGNSKLPMSQFAKGATFSAFDLAVVGESFPQELSEIFTELTSMLASGALKFAQPLQEYPVSRVEDALRLMQSGKSSGKMVLTVNDDDVVETLLHHRETYQLESSASYVIGGGLGGLGRSASRWMVSRGARNLILLSRSGPQSEAARQLVEELTAAGIQVATPRCDMTSVVSLSQALQECADMPPIKGCIQGSMVLRDALFESMTWQQWNSSTSSKVTSSWNLHSLLPDDLSFFVLLSSIIGTVGRMGQANYAAGNTYQDALAQHRRARGMAATSINLGWLRDVGIVAESGSLTERLQAAETLNPIYEPEFHALLDYYCDPARNLDRGRNSASTQPLLGFVTAAQARAAGRKIPDYLLDQPLFRALTCETGTPVFGSNGEGGTDGATAAGIEDRDLVAKFVSATSEPERAAIVENALVKKLARALSTVEAEINRARPLHVHGVDSLLAVEVRNWFAKLFQTDVAIFDITSQETLTALAAKAARGSKLSAVAMTANGGR